jgi:hypothetical protein
MGVLEDSLKVVKLATTLANPELYQAATKANVEALELSNKNIELQRKIGELESQVSDLEAKLKLTGEVFREGEFVYRVGDPGGFCSRCWDVEHKLVHIIRMDKGKDRGTGPGCPECKTFTWGHGQNPRMKAGA